MVAKKKRMQKVLMNKKKEYRIQESQVVKLNALYERVTKEKQKDVTTDNKRRSDS